MWTLAHEMRWYLMALVVVLLLITYIPGLVTWVPNLLMGPGR
jgi:TRAP-type C4-dicarboxylate transport system permease large subunit